MFTKVVNKVVKISADTAHAGLGINAGRSSEIFMTETCIACDLCDKLKTWCISCKRVNIQKNLT